MTLSANSAVKGATTARLLNRLAYDMANVAADITTAATGDQFVMIDASADYAVKYGDGANVLEAAGVTASAAELNNAADGMTATAAEVTRVADLSARIVDLAATALSVTLTEHGDRIVTLSHTGAASTATLPAATGTGMKVTFIVAAVNTDNHVIAAAGSDTLEGVAWMANDTDNTVSAFESTATDDKITLNGTTTGGAAIGDKVELVDYASGKWCVHALLTGTGTEATPLSSS